MVDNCSLRIMIVTRRYPPFVGGAERQLERVAKMLVRRGHSVTVICGRHDFECPLEERIGSLRVLRLSEPGVRFLGTAFFLFALILRMFFLVRKFDVVLASQVNETSTAAIFMGRVFGKRVVFRPGASGIAGDAFWTRTKLFGFVYRFAARRADGMIAQTEVLLREADDLGFPRDKVRVIPNLAPEIAEKVAFPDRKQNKHPLLFWCGRFEPVKRPELAVEAMRLLLARGVDCRLKMAGEGALSGTVATKIGEYGLAEHVELCGLVKDVTPCLMQADLLLNTSESEAMPNAVLEAMACGVPVVATATDGAKYLLNDGRCGLLCEIGAAGSLAGKIEEALASAELRENMARAARQSIDGSYSEAVVAPLYEKLLSA